MAIAQEPAESGSIPKTVPSRSRGSLDRTIILLVFAACALCVPFLNPRLRAALLPLGIAITVLLGGFLEGFYGIYFATKVNVICRHSGSGWLAPGVFAFALFNGGIRPIVAQGLEGFLTSFASGNAIAVVPAVTGNAWGGTLVQTLTNAVGSLRR